MFATIILLLFCLPTANCHCSLWPTVPPADTMYCSGVGVFDLPQLDVSVASKILKIYLHGTSITCLDSQHADKYKTLAYLGEEGNPYLNCTCLELWLQKNELASAYEDGYLRVVRLDSHCLTEMCPTPLSPTTSKQTEVGSTEPEVTMSIDTTVATTDPVVESTMSGLAAPIAAAAGGLLLVIAPLGAIVVKLRRRRSPCQRYGCCGGCRRRRSNSIGLAVDNPNWREGLEENINLAQFELDEDSEV